MLYLPRILLKSACRPLRHQNYLRLCSSFCDQKKPQNQESQQNDQKIGQKYQKQPQEQETISDEQKQLDKTFNQVFGYPEGHDFKKQLILSQNHYKKSLKQLKQAILFEDLLKSETKILIYDTKGKPFYLQFFKTSFLNIGCFVSKYGIQYLTTFDPKLYVILNQLPGSGIGNTIINICLIYIFIRVNFLFRKINNRYVQKIIYDTQTEDFIFTRRKFYGAKYQERVSRYKILYTQNQKLNKKGTNYLNIQTKAQYSIALKYAWVKQDLFSHLISQRIG